MSRDLDGVDDVITAGTVSPPTSSYSCLMKVRPDSVASTDLFFCWGDRTPLDATGDYFNQFFILNTDIFFRIFETSVLGDFIGRIATAGMSTNGIWYHLAGTWDGGTTSAACKIYINGIQEDDANNESGTVTAANANSSLRIIGAQQSDNGSGYDNFYDGQMSYISLFNRNLSINEIRQDMFYPGSIRKGLMGFWPLFGSASPEPDLSGNKNNGTVTGAIKGTSDPPINGLFQVKRPELVRSF